MGVWSNHPGPTPGVGKVHGTMSGTAAAASCQIQGDFMKTIFAIIFLALLSVPTSAAQYRCHGDPVCQANRDGFSVEKARSCTIEKCRQVQGRRGYTPAQTANWCPKNLHRGCN